MKKCPNCSFENNPESLFCQECGFKLPETKNKKVVKHHIESDEDHKFVWTCDFCGEEFPNKKNCDLHEKECDKRPISTAKNGIYQKLNNNDIDDIIFKPTRKKSHLFRNLIIIVSIFFFFIFIIILLDSYESSSGSTNKIDNSSQNNSNKYFSNVEINNLHLNGGNMTGNSYYEPNPTYEVTLHNSGSITARNIIIKINFYKPDDTNVGAVPQDTQYLKAAEILLPGDSAHINSIITTTFNTSGRFRWYAEVVSAEKY